MTKLTRLEVENFKRLVAIDFAPNQHVTEISGKNGNGKSSLLDAISVLIEGAAEAPPVPIRRGTEQATVRGTLGDMIAERVFKPGKDGKVISSITLRTPEGARYPEPQKHLNDLIGRHKLDPLDFINAKPKEQFDFVRSFVPGVDFEKVDKDQKADFDLRTNFNRNAKQERAAADLIIVPVGTPDELVDESALSKKMEDAGEHNRLLEQRKSRRALHANQIQTHRNDAQAKQDRINALLAEIDALKEEKTALVTLADRMQKELDDAEALPDPIDVSEVRAELENARKVNENVRQLQKRRQHEKSAREYEQQADQITERMSNRMQAKQSAIAKSNIPVSGIGFGDGEILLNALPFTQASTAEQLRTAFALIAAQNPTLRLAWIRDGSLLDDDSMQIVNALAEEFDMQVLIETVRPTSKNAIVIEDGRIKQKIEAAEVAA
jgi:energy-coupling factor transporter ATP-binding protein EcfA2